MASNPAIKQDAVYKWLKEIFHDEPIPRFEASTDFIEQLYDIMLSSKKLDQNVVDIDEFSSTYTSHFVEDTKHLLSNLEQVELKLVADPSSCSSEAKHLAGLACMLKLSDIENTSYILALSNLMLDKEKTTAEIDSLQSAINKKEADLADCLLKVEALERLYASVQQPIGLSAKAPASLSKEAAFLAQKKESYKDQKKKIDNKLDSYGLESSITHPKLKSDHEELCRLHERLQSTKEQLEMYASLPPDRELAQVKLAVAKSELQDLEDKLCKQIDMYHM